MAVKQYEYYYNDINFDTWAPKLLVEDVNDRAGQVIEAVYWNAQWNKHKTQGDYNSKTIDETLRKLNQSVWNSEDGLAMLYHADPTLAGRLEFAEGSVSEQLDWALKQTEQLLHVIEDDDGARFINVGTFTAVESGAVELADSTLSAILTYLKDLHVDLADTVAGIASNKLDAFDHNKIGGRDAAGAHTTEAITHEGNDLHTHLGDIADDITDMTTSLTNLTERIAAHANTEGSKHDAADISVKYQDDTSNVQAAINSLNIRISQITGEVEDIASLDIKHANLTDIDKSGHSAKVITLDDNRTVQAAITALEKNFRKIYAGTAAPASTTGSNGDIYIQYA